MKPRLVLFIKTPPPITGATTINKIVNESNYIRESFDVKSIEISYSSAVGEMGKKSVKKIWIVLVTWFRLFFLLISFRPQVVYFQLSPHGVAFLRDALYIFLIKLSNTKIIYHLHGKGIHEKSKLKVWNQLYSWIFKGSEVICLSPTLTADIKTVFDGNIHIVPNGITNLDNVSKLESTSNVIKILFLSNLIISKGILDFLKAISLINMQGIKAYIVGGEGTMSTAELSEHITELNLSSRVIYKGPLYGDKKYKMMREMDIMVHPTLNDAFPLVLLEAMQLGLPVISTPEGGIPEIVEDGVTGFIVNKNSPDEFAAKITMLANNKNLRIRMGQAAKNKFYKEYTLDQFERNMVNAFKTVINEKAKHV